MQSYYYHLKFELYATPDPTAAPAIADTRDTTVPTSGGRPSVPGGGEIWIPDSGASIFDDLPSHPRVRETTVRLARREERGGTRRGGYNTIQGAGVGTGVIDCGATRPSDQASDGEGNLVFLTERQWRARARSSPPPGFKAGIGPRTAARDWRFGRVRIESFDLINGESNMDTGKKMASESPGPNSGPQPQPAASLGPYLGGMGQATKGRFMPFETKNTEAGWGVVHLYREADESIALKAVPNSDVVDGVEGENGNDGTILCIPAVPSYLSPGDFLGFIGEKWRGDVSHYRMIMTSRLSRYMVLMKFRDCRIAEEWRKEFDGKPFDSVEVSAAPGWPSSVLMAWEQSEICHVTFIKSITVEAPNRTANNRSTTSNSDHYTSSSPTVVNTLRPFPPPTPNLIELPTCMVCLERMDDTAGLMTILCQHVFHCTCLQTWKGSGCPVCRATNPPTTAGGPDNPYSQPFGAGVSNLCTVCDSPEDLWICLICGNVGCGRYRGGHAKEHWKETAHSFSLELETQHVWDYAGDMWVHRLIRDKGDGKVVDFSTSNNSNNNSRRRGGLDGDGAGENEDVVPRSKLDNIGIEYTHLLTSQLESQRVYFEEMINKLADKAAKSAAIAETASVQAQKALKELATLKDEHRVLQDQTVPSLEKELGRERARAAKSTELARKLGASLQEEKKVSEGLMERIEHLNREAEASLKRLGQLEEENTSLQESNQDLLMFISGSQKLKEMEAEGKIDGSEVEAGTAYVPGDSGKGKLGGRKGKGKAKVSTAAANVSQEKKEESIVLNTSDGEGKEAEAGTSGLQDEKKKVKGKAKGKR